MKERCVGVADDILLNGCSPPHTTSFPVQGLGNAFLSHISACDALFHVVSESK